ncbi:hypothetical protein [Halobacterium zhouii]|uniref:hypothetical protein n=1 Tax=Halobacterium zhouii TaxID=2902624 RepID=UPI001E5CE56F|nr:hypothetical protein [Halobacterium zhouii]
MADSDSEGGLLQTPLTKLRGWLVPRLEASDRVSAEATALLDELLSADRDPERATEKLDAWVEKRK